MRTCHYQDRPGKRSFCLRTIEAGDVAALDDVKWKFCNSPDECPHRNWDQERRTNITKTRSELLGVCGECGRRHDLVIDQMICQVDGRVDRAIRDLKSSNGSTEPLLSQWLPRCMKDRAWRRVRAAVIKRDENTCRDCGRSLEEYPSWYTEVHHIVPVIGGGSDHPSNLVTLCVECHGRYTDDMCRQAPIVRSSKERDGNSHRKKASTSQSVLDEESPR